MKRDGSIGRLAILGNGWVDSFRSIKDADIIVTSELSAELAAKRENLTALYLHRYAQSEKVWRSIIAAGKKWLENWPKTPIFNGQSAIELFKFEDTSLWWFVYDAIWETKNGIFDTIYLAESLLSLIREYKPSEVELVGTFEYPIDLILESIAKKEDFRLIKDPHYTAKIGTLNELNRPSGKLNLVVRLVLLKAAKAFSRNRRRPSVAFFLTHGPTTIEKFHDEVHLISDHYLEGLEGYMAKTRDDNLLVSLNMPLVSRNYTRNLVSDMRKTANGLYLPWLSYYSLSDLLAWKRLVKYYLDVILSMENDPNFIESMHVDGIDIYPMLKHVFRGNLPRALAYVNVEIKLARKFVAEENPMVVFHTRGISAAGRALCFACISNGIKVITPQLGIISPEFPVNTAFEIAKDYDDRLLPICLTWGTFYSDILVSRGYPEHLVKAVGFWRTEETAKSNLFDSTQYLLYVAGANLGKLDYILSLDEELATIKSIRQVTPKMLKMIVKLHPSLPYDVYQAALNRLEGVDLIGGPGAANIEEYLAGAKVVVGKASTVLVQAMILHKPIIIVNFASTVNFIGIDSIPFATEPEQFAQFLKDILEGKNQNYDLQPYCEPTGQRSVSKIIDEIVNALGQNSQSPDSTGRM